MQVQASSHSNGALAKRTLTGERIERGIPIPDRALFGGKRNNNGRPPKLDLSRLGIGDSVLCKAKTERALVRVRANVHNAAKRAEIKVTTRTTDGGLRVWRTA